MQVIQCNYHEHGRAILDIINEAIVSSTAIYDYVPRTQASMQAWFEAKEKNDFPILGIEDKAAKLAGFASFGTFRGWPAYKYTVEHSIYIHRDYRRKGLAKLLMRELLAHARAQDIHAVIGCIDMKNTPSIQLHEKLGFRQCGILKEVGFKFGAWLDVGMYQLILDTPAHPVEG